VQNLNPLALLWLLNILAEGIKKGEMPEHLSLHSK
jgi:hypothetical protein